MDKDSIDFQDGYLINDFDGENCPACVNWNPSKLLSKLYEISYIPRKESKRCRFTNMEGHLEVPVEDGTIMAELQKTWATKYFRTRDGRLQWFASHFADDHPVGEILLSGCEIKANKENGTFMIRGGKNHVNMLVRANPTTNVFDKWRRALTTHSASSYMDVFVHPVPPPIPHITEKVVIIELGTTSFRAGLLTMEPSLPQIFFPNVCLVKENGKVIAGNEAFLPENRHSGKLVRTVRASSPTSGNFEIEKVALKACIEKCLRGLAIQPKSYRMLLSVPQDIPTAAIADMLRLFLREFGFMGVAISRQPSLVLYGYDATTGVVVEIGDAVSIVPIIDGYVLDNAIISLPYGARQISRALQEYLNEVDMGSFQFQSPVERLILRYVMEQSCYLAVDYENEAKKSEEQVKTIISLDEFDLDAGMPTSFTVSTARFETTEGLFKPKKWDMDTKGLHYLVNDAVQRSPIDTRKTLLRNIYLAGGASLLPGLAERLEMEISSLVSPALHTEVHISPWRYHVAYLGAQVVASSNAFDQTCVTRDTLDAFVVSLQSSV
ncbi:hypothetical protein AB6A40_001535 [Gnathostoma spinigerum]|uniref:PH domain-containing protein n=1 Tax=Gnathostoma spinigerum TaxID=75299 RepID=A0ABD6E5P0_9BILA